MDINGTNGESRFYIKQTSVFQNGKFGIRVLRLKCLDKPKFSLKKPAKINDLEVISLCSMMLS